MKLTVNLLSRIKEELDEKIKTSFVTNIFVLSSDDILLSFSFYRKEKLLISLNHHSPFLSLINYSDSIHTLLSQMNDVLRKEINGAYLLDIKQKDNDRVLYLTFHKTNDLYEKVEITMVLELIPHRSNLILLDENKKVIFANHYTTLEHIHPIVRGMKYEELPSLENNEEDKTSLKEFKDWANTYLDNVKDQRRKDQFLPLFVKVKNKIKSLNKKIITLEEGIKKAENDLSYKDEGNLIYTANNDISTIEEYINEGLLPHYDKDLDINQNASLMFKKYKKAKSTIEHSKIEIEKAHDDIKYYERILMQLEVGDDEELFELKELLIPQKSNKQRNKKAKISPSYIKVNNTIIAFGRTDEQNKVLTFEKSKPNYEFFHIENLSGSHVVIFSDNPTNEERLIASEIALILSKKDVGDIQTTKIKNVRKGEKMGLVYLKTYSNIHLNNVRESTKKLLEEKRKL